MQSHSIRRGLSLYDLVIVIFIIALLVALFLPSVSHSREAARRSSCLVKMKNIATALYTYHDTNLKLPPSALYNDKNLREMGIALKTVMPGNPGADAMDVTRAPYSIFVKLIPHYEAGHAFDSINFKTDEAFAPANFRNASRAFAFLLCPSFRGSPTSTAVDYQPPAGIGKPSLTNYKTLGAATLACLQDSTSVTNSELNGGVLHPYNSYNFSQLKAITQTAFLAETREQKYAAWWDGTTAAMPGFHPGSGNVTDDREPTPPKGVPALNVKSHGQQQAFITKDQFGGKEDMLWGPSSEHPGLVNHAFGDTHIRAITNGIDPTVYRAMISRRANDNDVIPAALK